MKDEIADFRTSVMPMIYDTRELISSLSPKIEATADDLSAILHGLRSQTQALEAVATDLVSRLRRQTVRVDGVLSGLFNTADRTGSAVADTVGRPIRQIAGLVASARAVVEALRSPNSKTHAAREQDNRDLFV
jgi:methyl-accepting chemotaxis protein